MEVLTEFLAGIDNLSHRERVEEVFTWIKNKYPNLKTELKWNQPVDYPLLEKMIDFNIQDKANCTTFWRK